jgi:hypothetical protein
MTSSTHAVHRDLAWALKQQALRAGEGSPAVRGADWRTAAVTGVNGDGTIAVDGIPAVRCLDTYVHPTVGDIVLITQSSSGNWAAWGRTSTGGIAIGQTVTARKTVSTPRASTTTVTVDPHLALTVVPGIYKLDAFLMYDGDAAADMNSSGAAFASLPRWGALSDITTSTLNVGTIGANTIVVCRPVGTVVVTTAGTFALQWAQGASSATSTILRGQSTLELRRIA